MILQKIKAFGYVFRNSAYNVGYYYDLTFTNVSFTIKYYFTLTAIIALVLTGINSTKIMNEVNKYAQEAVYTALNAYPNDLVITAKAGRVKVNKPEPYIIYTPENNKIEGLPKMLIVFDSEGTLNELQQSEALILVNKANVLIKNARTIEVYSTAQIQDGEINKTNYTKFVEKLATYIPHLKIILAVLLFIAFIFYYWVLNMVYLAWAGVLVLLLGKVKNLDLAYSKYFQIGVHAATLPLILDAILGLFNLSNKMPFWFLIAHMLVVFIMLEGVAENTRNSNIVQKSA